MRRATGDVRLVTCDVRRAALAALVCVTAYGALLRLDAFTQKYGWLDQPGWALTAEARLLPAIRALRPAAIGWGRVDTGYAGGDPANYIRFAREMRHFYQAHVREPVFLALTRGMLWLTGGRDVSVSYASMLCSAAAIVAAYLLGAAAFSRGVGLAAAAALAIELDAVVWGVDGWRDDTFMLAVTLCGWSCLRLARHPTRANAILAGVLGAAACLTRLSALSFVAPALLWIVADAPRGGRRPLARGAATAGVVTMALIAPYLINCARETGDPFYAVNYHTVYYRAAEGLPGDPSVGAIEHIAQKLRARPVATIDTGAVGLFVFPFARKWGGFRAWWPPLEPLLRWLAACGLLLAVWSRAGRLLLVVIVMSLVPYALTWSVGGGGDWRFTQHVYPFYLVLGFGAVQTVWPAARALAARQVPARDAALALRRPRVIAFAAAGALAAAAYLAAPFFVVREALAAGEAASITSGPRDWPFFAGGWSDPSGGGNVVVRTAVAERAAVRLPLPGTRAYRLTLRMDPAETADPALQPRVTVFLDGRTIGQVRFQRDPQRVGTYRMAIPAELSGRLAARLDLVASHTVPASEAGLHFAWLPPATPVAFRLWYVRLEPE